MQALPELPIDGVIDIGSSNQSQRRGSHGAFRYFGKLAPDVTGRVLELFEEHFGQPDGPIVDMMCGSGTTLIEASDKGWTAMGFDVNPVATLFASVKTTPVDVGRLKSYVERVLASGHPTPGQVEELFSSTRSAHRWFNQEAMRQISRLRIGIADLPESQEKSLLLAVLLSRVRRISNASAKTGRIFYDPRSAADDPAGDFEAAAMQALKWVPRERLPVAAILADARSLPLKAGTAALTFLHPPYYALYRFSADVLRFELEIGGWSRRRVNVHEIAEGWKSGDPALLEDYVRDMTAVFVEAQRVTRTGGAFVLVASNSTLGDVQLPVIDRLALAAQSVGLSVHAHYERKAHHGSASYHRSARDDKVINQDHVVLFKV